MDCESIRFIPTRVRVVTPQHGLGGPGKDGTSGLSKDKVWGKG